MWGGSNVWASGDCGGDVDNGDDAMAAAMQPAAVTVDVPIVHTAVT